MPKNNKINPMTLAVILMAVLYFSGPGLFELQAVTNYCDSVLQTSDSSGFSFTPTSDYVLSKMVVTASRDGKPGSCSFSISDSKGIVQSTSYNGNSLPTLPGDVSIGMADAIIVSAGETYTFDLACPGSLNNNGGLNDGPSQSWGKPATESCLDPGPPAVMFRTSDPAYDSGYIAFNLFCSSGGPLTKYGMSGLGGGSTQFMCEERFGKQLISNLPGNIRSECDSTSLYYDEGIFFTCCNVDDTGVTDGMFFIPYSAIGEETSAVLDAPNEIMCSALCTVGDLDCDSLIDWDELNTAIREWLAGNHSWSILNEIIAAWINR